MTDKIVYYIADNGIDGRAPTSYVYASYFDKIRDRVFENSRNKAWYSKGKRIVEVESETKQALAKLNGIERLLLKIDQKEIK